MVVTQDLALAQRAGRLRNYGQSVRYHHPELGMNSRLDEIHAAMLADRLKWLPEFTERRRQIADAYRTGIKNSAVQQLAAPEEYAAHAYHLYVITCDSREALQAHLLLNRVQSLIHYPIPVHHQEPCRGIKRDPLGLSSSEQYSDTCLSLPCHPQMTDADVATVVGAINAFK